jgi:hypothetical protein
VLTIVSPIEDDGLEDTKIIVNEPINLPSVEPEKVKRAYKKKSQKS